MVKVLAVQAFISNLGMTICGGLGMTRLVTYTTRPPIDTEQDGLEYHFIKPVYFTKLMTEGFFANVSVFEGNYYGIPKGIEKVDEPTCLFVVPENISYLKRLYGDKCLAVGTVLAWPYVEKTIKSARQLGVSVEDHREEYIEQLKRLDNCDLILNVSDTNHEQINSFIGNINGLVLKRGYQR